MQVKIINNDAAHNINSLIPILVDKLKGNKLDVECKLEVDTANNSLVITCETKDISDTFVLAMHDDFFYFSSDTLELDLIGYPLDCNNKIDFNAMADIINSIIYGMVSLYVLTGRFK